LFLALVNVLGAWVVMHLLHVANAAWGFLVQSSYLIVACCGLFFMQVLSNHRWLRRLAVAVVGVVALWLLSWLALPHLLRAQGQKLASEALGRQVTIGGVEFAPWSLELTVHDLAVASLDGQSSQLSVKRIYIDAEMQSLLRLAPVLDAIEVDAPVLKVAQLAPGEYDIDDILQRFMRPDEAPKEPEKSGTQRFALYNMALHGGSVDFEDRTVGRTHTVRELELSVPFLSSLKSKREIKVEPRLAFSLNGSRFDSSTEATPFLDSRKTDAQVRLAGFDLKPYLDYFPKSLPVRLQAGVLDVDLRVAFLQQPEASVHLQGSVRGQGVRLADAREQPLLSFDSLDVQIADLEPLARRGRIASVNLVAPHVTAQRMRDGQINWAQLGGAQGVAQPDSADKPAKAAATPASAASAPTSHAGGGAAPNTDWAVVVDKVNVRDAAVDWMDEAVAGGAHIALSDLAVQASGIAIPFEKPFGFFGQAKLNEGREKRSDAATLALHGQATDRMASVAVSLNDASLALVTPYVAEHLVPQLSGRLQADLGLAWHGPAVVVQLASLSLNDVGLSCPAKGECAGAGLAGIAMRGKNSLAEWKNLRVENAQVDLLRRTVNVERIALAQPRAMVSRDKHGRWMAEHWQVAGERSREETTSARAAETSAAPWSVQLGAVELDGGAVAFRDAMPATPVALNLSSLRLHISDLAPLAGKGAKPSPLSLSARIGAGRADPGRLEYDGTVGLAPLSAHGKVQAVQLPLHAFEPYWADLLNVRVLRADGSFKGNVEFAQAEAGAQVRVRGDAALDDLRVRSALLANPAAATASAPTDAGERGSLALQEDLLHWKSLGLRGVDVAMAPGRATQVEVRETALSDFFARVIVQESGRINLQDVLKSSEPSTSAAAANAAQAPAAAPASTSETHALAPVVRFGPVSLTGGQVRFSDYFIRPNYSADLSDLAGRLSAFSSEAPAQGGAPEMADLELRGRAEGTASLEITGKLNPLVKPLALDIEGKMRDLELPPLSPYTVKYAGHGIERGKLSMDVAYKVQPDGQLTARNKLVLNQLTFGEPVQGAPASLPVRLAVALLADRNGVIDLDLPLSGSLNDPEFRLAPVIFKIIGNVIMKAVTAPFSLLMGAFGGGDDLSAVNFAPGSAVLDADARAALDKVAKALTERPALKLTVVGEAQLDAERDGWKRMQLQRLLMAQKRRAAVRGGESAAQVSEIAPEEESGLLKEVYRRADIPKPRNLVGMAKDLPAAEMQNLLLASIAVPADAMQELAVARGVAVRDYLAQHKVSLDRLFLGAAKSQVKDAQWKPRAQFTLSSQ
jgi:uncharacterized protein involved in outer membrane biogenesis